MSNHERQVLLGLDCRTHSNPADIVSLHALWPYTNVPNLGAALHAATILESRGFIKLDRETVLEDNRLQITPAGIAEAARLRLPFWKRWLSDVALVRALAAAVLGGIVVKVGDGLLRLL